MIIKYTPHTLFASTCLVALLALNAPATADTAIPIDLRPFYADTTVTVSADGMSALMEEDPQLAVVFLSNDPTLSDPGISFASKPVSLSFSYRFTETSDGDDALYARVFNGSTGDLINEWSIDTTQSGAFTWNLQNMDSGITLLGLEFQLRAYDLTIGSSAEVSNVTLTTQSTPVPLPSSLLLFSSGTLGIAAFARRRHNQ